MILDYVLTKKVSQVLSLNYHNTSAKINIAILIAIIFAKSIVIHIAIPQKLSRYNIAAILYPEINNPDGQCLFNEQKYVHTPT